MNCSTQALRHVYNVCRVADYTYTRVRDCVQLRGHGKTPCHRRSDAKGRNEAQRLFVLVQVLNATEIPKTAPSTIAVRPPAANIGLLEQLQGLVAFEALCSYDGSTNQRDLAKPIRTTGVVFFLCAIARFRKLQQRRSSRRALCVTTGLLPSDWRGFRRQNKSTYLVSS